MSNSTFATLRKAVSAVLKIIGLSVFGTAMVLMLAANPAVFKALVLLAVAVVLALVTIFLLADLGAYFRKVTEGTIMFLDAGSSMLDVWPNVRGKMMSEKKDPDGRRWLITAKTGQERLDAFFVRSKTLVGFQKGLWKRFGIRFMSFFYPQIDVHMINLGKGGRRRLVPRAEGASLRSRIIDSHGSDDPNKVDSLLFLVPRPVYVEGVELSGDNSRVNMVVLAIFQLVIPTLPVYNLQGDFFSFLDSVIEAGIVDFCAKGSLTYEAWLKLPKAGVGSPLEKSLLLLNISKRYVDEGLREADTLAAFARDHLPGGPNDISDDSSVAQLIPDGIVPRFGFALVGFNIVEWEAHETTKDLAKAILDKEAARHNAEAVEREAVGQKKALQQLAEGNAARFSQGVEALTSHEVDPDVAAQVMGTLVRMESIRDSKLTTYVEGNSSAIPTIPVQQGANPPAGSNQSAPTQ